MRFTILQSEFSKALSMGGKMVSSRSSLPILSNILLRVSGSGIELVSTNLETATRAFLECSVSAKGETTLNGKTFYEFVSQLPEGELVVEKLGEEVVVSTKGYNGRFATMPAEEFPAIPKIEKGISLEVEAGQLVSAISKTAFCAAQDEGRPVLTGVLCEIGKGKLKVVATDGYRLGYDEVVVDNAKGVPELKINVPAKAMAEVARIIGEAGIFGEKEEGDKKDAFEIKVSVSDSLNQINFQINGLFANGEGVEFTSRLIEGEFPNWQKIIPSAFNTKARVNKSDFIKLVKVASIFAREAGNIVKLKFEAQGKGSILNVNALSSQVGSTDASCEVEMSGQGGEIAFNYRYILEVLSQIPDSQVYFEMNESLNPGKITTNDPKDPFFHIIMPVRLQA